MRTLDSDYSDWKIGDKVVWELEPYHASLPLEIIGIDREKGIIHYKTNNGDKNQVKREYLMRVTEREIIKTDMADLEKLINELCGLPKYDLEGDEDTVVVRWEEGVNNSIFIALEEWNECVFLDPSQALTLLEWLSSQRPNLEALRDALQAQQAQEEATKAQREAERINALKAKHSDAVVAWQQGGCVGPCPRFKDIVARESLVRVELFEESAEAPVFIKKYPMFERLRKGQIG